MNYKIEQMKSSDWKQVSEIYLEGIETGKATFQAEVPTWENWNSSHIESCRLVVHSDDKVLGWAALSPFSKRPVYLGVADVSIYIGEKYRGFGIGKILLNHLVVESEKNGFWTLQSRIIHENNASIALHKKCGFREVGIKEKLGKMDNGIWCDVVLMERRSKIVGLD
jgi:phosphinothricin acetyltransferase